MIEEIIKRFYKETGKSLTTEAITDVKHYSIDYVNWLENKYLEVINFTGSSHELCEHKLDDIKFKNKYGAECKCGHKVAYF